MGKKTKFNGFEKWVIDQALEVWVEQAEADILEAEKSDRPSIIAPGYFTQVTKDLKQKVKSMTYKEHLKHSVQ